MFFSIIHFLDTVSNSAENITPVQAKIIQAISSRIQINSWREYSATFDEEQEYMGWEMWAFFQFLPSIPQEHIIKSVNSMVNKGLLLKMYYSFNDEYVYAWTNDYKYWHLLNK